MPPNLKSLQSRFSSGVEHRKVEDLVRERGTISGEFLLMSGLSAAIAVLGLLLSSPAVVIGAMLLSPLMGPIILLGFSFWSLDFGGLKRALISLAASFAVALVVSLLLTWASPLKEATDEIIARSRPTLFDLLVAIFSGVAGAFAVVREKGETVIGVAIATALMPPLATIGFGLGVQAWTIAEGAALLFSTNLVAIAVAAAAVAGVFGFQMKQPWSKGHWLRGLLVVGVLAALCVPLTVSLTTIALQAQATTAARAELKAQFGPRARITSLRVTAQQARLEVSVLVATPRFVADAGGALSRKLHEKLGHPIDATVEQVVIADPARISAESETRPAPSPLSDADRLKQAIPFATREIAYSPDRKRWSVTLAEGSGLGLAGAMALEQGLKAQPQWTDVEVVPPLAALPPLRIGFDASAPVIPSELSVQLWALRRWGALAATATWCGSLSTQREQALRQALNSDADRLPVAFETAVRCGPLRPGELQLSPATAASSPIDSGRSAQASPSPTPIAPPAS